MSEATSAKTAGTDPHNSASEPTKEGCSCCAGLIKLLCSDSPPPSKPAHKPKQKLLDKYSLGKQLGQGAFGIVYLCTKKDSNDEYAVKMIDKVEMPMMQIMQEAELQFELSHPCIAKLYDVIDEKVFVCMVLDLYKGGDMIEGMQTHWETKGKIPINVIQNLTKMCVHSVNWLHDKSIVHRDLKGDNFLMDRKDIENPQCRIYMSDFGTAMKLESHQRLNQRCGTKIYWSPEFYDLNYSIAVDIWAIGVIVFGLAAGRFPFKGESECKTKPVRFPSRITPEGESFILATLTRSETERVTAKRALEHPFLSAIQCAAQEHVVAWEHGFKPELREAGANVGVQERRQELVGRLAAAASASHSRVSATVKEVQGNFQTKDMASGKTCNFEWWGAQKARDANFVDLSKALKVDNVDTITMTDSSAGIRVLLEGHGIDTEKFGVGGAKSLDELVEEVHRGQSRLMLDAEQHKSIVRVVDLVLLRLSFGEGANKMYVVKPPETLADGSVATQLPGAKKLPHASARQTIMHIVKKNLGFEDGQVSIPQEHTWAFESEQPGGYPGLRTVYCKEIYECKVTTTDPQVLARVGLGPGSNSTLSHQHKTFHWISEAECQSRQVIMQAPDTAQEMSALVHAPIGFDEDELEEFLEANDICTPGGARGAKMLKELSEELVKGQAKLTHKADGSVIRLVEVVILQVSQTNGDVLVQLENRHTGQMGRLPGVKRRPDENPFRAAKRVLGKALKISENLVEMDPAQVFCVEEETLSEAFEGLPTIYRRVLIPATLVQG